MEYCMSKNDKLLAAAIRRALAEQVRRRMVELVPCGGLAGVCSRNLIARLLRSGHRVMTVDQPGGLPMLYAVRRRARSEPS